MALKDHSYSGTLGAFTPLSGTGYTQYAANIFWGDGTSTMGSIDASCNISGSHTYNAAGTYPVTLKVTWIGYTASGVGIALGLVENLTDDSQLQVADSYTLSQSSNTSQSGSDVSGGGFSLEETGTLAYDLAKNLYQVAGSLSSQASDTLTFTLQEAGSEGPGTFSVGDFTLTGTTTETSTVSQFSNDFNSYSSLTGSGTATATLSENGSGSGAYGNAETFSSTTTGSDSQTLSGSGSDGNGSFSTTTTPSESTTLTAGGDYSGSITWTRTASGSNTVTTTGNEGADDYTQTQTYTSTQSTLSETETYSSGSYTATTTSSDSYTLSDNGTDAAGTATDTGAGSDAATLTAGNGMGAFRSVQTQSGGTSDTTTGTDEDDDFTDSAFADLQQRHHPDRHRAATTTP